VFCKKPIRHRRLPLKQRGLYDEDTELPSELSMDDIDAAIAKLEEAIWELNKLIGRLEEARPQK
jgi:hypothetical protein